LWSLSYFSQRYNCMLAPSKTRFGLPDVLSTIAGIRPLAMKTFVRDCLCSTQCYVTFDVYETRLGNQLKVHDLRLISRNHGSFCWFLLNSSLCTLYWRPSSSRVIEILWPFGVPAFCIPLVSFHDRSMGTDPDAQCKARLQCWAPL